MGLSTSDPESALLAHLAEYGLDPGTIKWDRKIHRFPGRGKGKRNEAAYYRAFEDRRGASFGDYSQGIDEPLTWQHRDEVVGKLSTEEFAERERQWREDAEAREAERIREQEAAAAKCLARWKAASQDVDLDHPYLRAKRIDSAPGVRQEGDLLLVPMKLFGDGNPLVNIQTIDPRGDKRFSYGGVVRGTRTTIGARAFKADPERILYLCEGWATGRAVHRSTGKGVVVAFNAGNLASVASLLREEYPNARIIICADNDRWSSIRRDGRDVPNPGVHFAQAAARVSGGEVAVPDFASLRDRPTDFHDLYLREGADAVVSWLDPGRARYADRLGNDAAPSPEVAEGASVQPPLAAQPWPTEPRPPGALVPELLPLDALPAGLRAHVASVSDALQVPPDMSIVLALGIISAAVAGRVEIQPRRGWTQPIALYTAVILPPASRKSPAFSHMIAPLRRLEAGDVERAKPALLAAQDVVGVAERTLDRVKTGAARSKATTEDVEIARRDLEEARAQVPPDGRLLAGDITPEAMVLRMAQQGGRLAILEPEPGPLQLLAGRYSNGARLDEIKKAWSAEGITVDRVNRPPVQVPRPVLTLTLCVQPGVLESLEQGKAFRYEGVLGRFLWVQPPHGLGSRRTGADVPVIDVRAEQQYAATVERLWNVQPERGPDGSEAPHLLRLSSGALAVLHAYEAEVEAQLADGARLESIRDWAGKCVGQSLRVAALLELAQRAENGESLLGQPVSAWAMASAVRLMRAFTSHSLLVLGASDEKTVILAYVLRRMIELVGRQDGEVSVRDLFQACKGKAGIDRVDDVNKYVAELTALGCMRLTLVQSSGPGRPESPRLELHPDLCGSTPKIPKMPLVATGEAHSGDSGDEFASATPSLISDEVDPLQLLEDVPR